MDNLHSIEGVRELQEHELNLVSGGEALDSGNPPPETQGPRAIRVDRAYRK